MRLHGSYVAPTTSLMRLPVYTGCASRSTSSLRSLCWRIQFFMGLHHVTWVRLSVSDLPGRRCLRSASTDRLGVPSFKLSTIGSRTFKIAAAQTWNALLEDVTTSPTLPIFRKRLKTQSYLTFFFKLTYCIYTHSGFEVTRLLRPLTKIMVD